MLMKILGGLSGIITAATTPANNNLRGVINTFFMCRRRVWPIIDFRLLFACFVCKFNELVELSVSAIYGA